MKRARMSGGSCSSSASTTSFRVSTVHVIAGSFQYSFFAIPTGSPLRAAERCSALEFLHFWWGRRSFFVVCHQSGARPSRLAGDVHQAGLYGIILDIGDQILELFRRAYPMVERFVLPKRCAGPP